MELEFYELDALNVMYNWFGGKINAADCFVASLDTSTFRDLADEGYVRKRWIGWEITKKGIKALEDNGIEEFSDTRHY